jgi:hypothetical protein
MEECRYWRKPTRIQVVPDGKFDRIVRYDYEEREEENNVIDILDYKDGSF